MKFRRIIQIQTCGADHCGQALHALCDDGSLWRWVATYEKWIRMDVEGVETAPSPVPLPPPII